MLHFFAKRLKKMQEVSHDERGFTLIELLVVITLPFHKRLALRVSGPTDFQQPVGKHDG